MLTSPAGPERRLIDISRSIESPIGRKLYSLVGTPFELLFSVPALNRLYAQTSAPQTEAASFFGRVLAALNVSYEISEEDRQRIPIEGPVVVVANHPYGAIEGLILGDLLTRARPDVKILGNHLLGNVEGMAPWLITVDPFGGKTAAHSNIGSIKTCLRFLRQAGLLVTFPSGTVSHLHLRRGQVLDPRWHQGAALLARRTGATVLPIYFEGRNSALFQLMGLVHGGLRTALLPHELFKRSHSTVRLAIGKPITPEKISDFSDEAVLTDYLRFKTYALARREDAVRPRFRQPEPAGAAPAEIIEAVPKQVMAAEIARLPTESLLTAQGPLQVYVAGHEQIPASLREIGRLREVTFRAAGEGTGRALDLDEFDRRYVHIFMWNADAQDVVGSYRLGLADQILNEHGQSGLYTSTLFKFKAGFLERLSPAIELGRSFIRQEYQRKHSSLAVLWRGIGEFLVRHPQYKTLFGPVSISRNYKCVSRRLLIEFLSNVHGDERLKGLVRPKNPPRDRLGLEERQALDQMVRDADDVSKLIAELEDDDKGMPVLLKHYLKLNARLLGFNVDPAFGNCTDGLILVDLRTTEPKLLKRFMGDAGHRFFSSVA